MDKRAADRAGIFMSNELKGDSQGMSHDETVEVPASRVTVLPSRWRSSLRVEVTCGSPIIRIFNAQGQPVKGTVRLVEQEY